MPPAAQTRAEAVPIRRPAGLVAALRATPTLLFLQMLVATVVIPGIRPLFATFHGGAEGAMHAFMSLNMVGALVAAPIVGSLADRLGRRDPLLAVLALADGLLLVLIATPLPTPVVLGLRVLEGGAHVGAATLLLAEAAAQARRGAAGRTMGVAGFAIMLAVAAGTALGGLVVALDPRGPFWLGAGLALAVALSSCGRAPAAAEARPRVRLGDALRLLAERALWPILGAAFVARFAVGALVVTFALYAHDAFAASDREIGLLFAALTTTFALATYPSGRLGDRLGRPALLALGCALSGLALLALRVAPAPLLAVVLVVLGLGSALVFASILGCAPTQAGPDARGRLVALINAAGCLGMLLGPAVAGLVSAALRDAADPLRGARAVFAVAAGGFALWLAAAARWVAAAQSAQQRKPVE